MNFNENEGKYPVEIEKGDKKRSERDFDKERMTEYYTRKYKGLTSQEIEEKVETDLDKIEAENKEFEDNVKRLTIEAKQDPEGFKEATKRIHDLAREIVLLRTSNYGVENILTGDITMKLSIKNAERVDAYNHALLEIEAEKAEKATAQG